MSESVWFYSDLSGTSQGPVSFFDLQALSAADLLTPDTLVWKHGFESWIKIVLASELAGLVSKPEKVEKETKEKKEYQYTNEQGKKTGPVSKEEIGKLAVDGLINGQTLGWQKGMTQWTALCEIVSLRSIFPPVEVPVFEKEHVEVDLEAEGDDLPEVEEEVVKPKETDDTKEQGKKKHSRVNHLRNLKQHQSIHLTHLPDDAKADEIVDFCKKCGMSILKVVQKNLIIVLEDPNTGLPIVYLFVTDSGTRRGDAMPESVDLAVQILDESLLRVNAKPVRVERADWFQMNKSIQLLKRLGPKEEIPHNKVVKKRKITSQMKQLNWQDSDEEILSDDDDPKHRFGKKIVIIKHLFNPSEADNDPKFYEELEMEIGEEISRKCGTLEKLTIFEGNTDGVVAARFKSHLHAEKCIEEFDGRFFDKRKLTCEFFDGKTNYKVVTAKSEEDEAKRLDEFGKWLEDQEDKDD